VWRCGDFGEEDLLASCYRRCLELAAEHNVVSIAFPAISTGIYGFPRQRAAEIAVATVKANAAASLQRVIFSCFDDDTAQIYRKLLAS
jgi:O-acetyl-ADP-ribose deacetylase (regulator of RNase III)